MNSNQKSVHVGIERTVKMTMIQRNYQCSYSKRKKKTETENKKKRTAALPKLMKLFTLPNDKINSTTEEPTASEKPAAAVDNVGVEGKVEEVEVE